MNKLKIILTAILFLSILSGTVAATCQPAPIPPPVATPGLPQAPGAIALVGSKWVSGNLVFTDSSGNTIFTIDATNRALVVASAAALNFTTGSTAYTSLGNFSSVQLAVRITDETGTGPIVYATSPTLVTPTLGIVQSGSTWNGASVTYDYLGNMTSAQLAVRLTDETGTGLNVFGTSPSLTTPTIASPTFTGGILVATTAFNGGTGVIAVGNGSAPTYAVNTAQLYVSGGVLYVLDGGNVSTVLKYTKGTTSIPVGDTAASVTHSFGATPSVVLVSWQSETDPIAVAASTVYLRSS